MVKTYFKYQVQRTVGNVASSQCNFAHHAPSKRIFSGTCQYVAVIHHRTGEVVTYLSRENKNRPVRCVAVFGDRVFAGFEDGEIASWDCNTLEFINSLDLHKSAVTSLKANDDLTLLVSAGQDCRIIVWDLLSEEPSTIKQAHKAPITDLQLLTLYNPLSCLNEELILTAAKDGFVKVWSLTSLQLLDVYSTLTNEVCCFAYNPFSNLLYVGTNREDILIVKLEPTKDEQTKIMRYCEQVGRFKRSTFARPLQMVLQPGKISVLNSDKQLEVYALLDDREFLKRKKRIAKRQKGKEPKLIEEEDEEPENTQADNQEGARLKLQKVYPLLQKAFNMLTLEPRLLLNNGRDIFELSTGEALTHSLGITHQLSLAHPYLVQRSYTKCKVISVTNMTPLYSVDYEQDNIKITACQIYKGYLLTLTDSSLIVWSLAKGEELTREEGFGGNGLSVSDSGILVWKNMELTFAAIGYNKSREIAISKTGEQFYSQTIMQCSYLNQDKYLVCTQDATVNVFYSDTHRPHLKLYGHKMPILCYDTSSDEALIVTGSVDKDIKIWGLDFGNCQKSIFAHTEPVTAVKFVHNTHYFFSGSRDGHVKYWDGDTHQLILDLEDSVGEIRDICVSRAGDWMVAGGNDGGFRVWRQTNEQVYFAEQQEKRVEKMMIEDYANSKLQENTEKTTYSDLKHGEQIIECLENADKPQVLLKLLKEISPPKLKPSLSFLHRHHVQRLTVYLKFYLERGIDLELVWRVCEGLDLKELDVGQGLRSQWEKDRDIIRVNAEALRLVSNRIKQNREMGMIQ